MACSYIWKKFAILEWRKKMAVSPFIFLSIHRWYFRVSVKGCGHMFTLEAALPFPSPHLIHLWIYVQIFSAVSVPWYPVWRWAPQFPSPASSSNLQSEAVVRVPIATSSNRCPIRSSVQKRPGWESRTAASEWALLEVVGQGRWGCNAEPLNCSKSQNSSSCPSLARRTRMQEAWVQMSAQSWKLTGIWNC